MPLPTAPFLEDRPRWLLAWLSVATTLAVAWSLMPAWAPPGGAAIAGAALVVAGSLLSVWRARRPSAERPVWRRLGSLVVLQAVAFIVGLSFTLTPSAGPRQTALLLAGVPLCFPALYAGVVRWNRPRRSAVDPDDLLNGLCAMMASDGLLNTLVRDGLLPTSGLSWWALQPALATVAGCFVLCGAAASTASLNGLARDRRIWLVAAALGGFAALVAIVVVRGGRVAGWPEALWALDAALVPLALILRPGTPAASRPSDAVDSTVGSFIVVLFSLGILATNAIHPIGWVATLCAAAAGAGCSARTLLNVQELSQLAVSRREALTDELTGLHNRRGILRTLEESCAGGMPVQFAIIDLDKFKEVNDGLGHANGDKLLQIAADRLRRALAGTGAVVGRLGGDEFAIVAGTSTSSTAPGPGPRSADHGRDHSDEQALALRLLGAFNEPFALGPVTIHAAASVGVASTGLVGERRLGPAVLLQRADAAMYHAKRERSGAAVYDRSIHTDAGGQLALVEQLRVGLNRGELCLLYQPQIDVATGTITGAEALIRWNHPVRGSVAPAEFLPAAELHGLMGEITDFVLASAVAQAAIWDRSERPLRVSVNLSATNLLDTGLPDRLARLLAAHHLPARLLVLEVTETVIMADRERSLAVVAALAAQGMTVSIDDFGTGYSSLAYLRDLPVGELKLDRSFTADLVDNRRSEAIVASAIELAHALELRVVAEGVEDEPTQACLERLGCDEAQGYLHSRPLPVPQFEQWWTDREAERGLTELIGRTPDGANA